MKILEVRNVSLTYPQTRFEKKKKMIPSKIGPINLNFSNSEIVGIIGRNGSGKSTLLRIMGGVFPPDEGEIQISGTISLLAGVGVGFNKNLTGLENTYLYASLMGWKKRDIEKQLEDIIRFSELGHNFDRPIRTYSSGMKARLGISVATAFRPDILLIDEVLGVGDPNFKEKSTNRIMEMVKGAGTVVIVSHSFGMLAGVSKRPLLNPRVLSAPAMAGRAQKACSR